MRAAERGKQESRSSMPQTECWQRTLKAAYWDEVSYRKTGKKPGVPILIHAFLPNDEFSRIGHLGTQ